MLELQEFGIETRFADARKDSLVQMCETGIKITCSFVYECQKDGLWVNYTRSYFFDKDKEMYDSMKS